MNSITELPRIRHDMGELMPYCHGPALATAALETHMLKVQWDDGSEGRFPLLWLRDHCACAQCRHPQTRERLYRMIDDPLVSEDGSLPAPTIDSEDGVLTLRWADGHESRFDSVWLYQRRPGANARPQSTPPARAWREHFMPERIEHADFIAAGEGQRRWLEALLRDGLVLLDNGPTELDEVICVAESIGPLRATNFGARFDVISKPNPNNAAYTAIELELHTDLPNWRNPPDIQLLYCLENDAEGGASVFADGFAVAEALRHEAPDQFALLAETPIDLRFQDEHHDIAVRAPIIEVDDHGRLREIRFNNWIRDTLDVEPERIAAWYAAYQAFWSRLRAARFRADFSLAPGQMIAFDNRRVLHGRDEFDPNTGKRHLQGCYLDYDMIESKLKVLARSVSP